MADALGIQVADVLPWLMDATIKASLIGACALMCLALLAGGAARYRRALLTLALLGVVMTPLLTPATWTRRLDLVTWRPVTPVASPATPDRGVSKFDAPTPSVSPVASWPSRSGDENEALISRSHSAEIAPARAASAISPMPIIGIWLAGMLAVLSYGATGHLRAWLLVRRATPVKQGCWKMHLDQLAAEVGISRVPGVAHSSSVTSPLIWGVRRTVILLPTHALSWSDERVRLTLLHELFHVKRADCITQIVALFACGLHWFNPLVWACVRRLGFERERACDEAVLSSGVQASTYASHLLEAARVMSQGQAAPRPMLALARSASLERRLLGLRAWAIQPHEHALAGRSALALLLAMVGCLGGVRLAAASLDQHLGPPPMTPAPLIINKPNSFLEGFPAENRGSEESVDPSGAQWMLATVTMTPGRQNAFARPMQPGRDEAFDLTWTEGDTVIRFRTRGRVRFDERSLWIMQLGDDASVTIESRRGNVQRRLLIRNGKAGTRRFEYFDDDRRVAFTEEDRLWSDRVLRAAAVRLESFL